MRKPHKWRPYVSSFSFAAGCTLTALQLWGWSMVFEFAIPHILNAE